MKYVVLLVVVLGLAGGSAVWFREKAKGDGGPPPMTAKVERGDIRVSVSATGAVASNKDVDIKCKASGEVLKLPYDISDQVKPKALLMLLDTTDETRSLDEAKAVLDSDSAKITEAQLDWQSAKLNLVTTRERDEAALARAIAKANDADAKAKRTSDLFDQKLDSKEDLETAQTTAALAHADVDTAKAAIAELDQQKIALDVKQHDIELAQAQQKQDQIKAEIAQQAVDYCTVTAPPLDAPNGNWTVSALTVQTGTLVQSGTSSVSGGTAVMTLSDLSHIFVLATVDESDIGHVREGQDVSITADSYKGIEFKGKVVRIATTGVNTSNVVTFSVKIEVLSKNRLLLKPMMTANVDIISAEKKNVVLVPMQAVSRRHVEMTADDVDPPAGGGAAQTAAAPATEAATQHLAEPKMHNAIFPGTAQVLLANGKTEARDVRVGINDGANYEVISGLDPGDTVVLNKTGADSKFSGHGHK